MPFIAFEGVDGSGKSTLLKNLETELKSRAVVTLVTREPGGTELGEEIRELLLRTHAEAPVPRAELLLYQAGRAQHVELLIKPAVARGDWVLCDRYTASSEAFQCGGRGLPLDEVRRLNDYSTAQLKPDLWVLVDLSVADSLKRRQMREADRFEREAEDFHQRVRQHYLQMAKQEPDRWLVLDGRKSPEELKQDLLAELKRRRWLA